MKNRTAQIFDALRRGWQTYGSLQAMRLSTCPWVRIKEGEANHLRPHEQIKRRTRKDGLQEMKIVRATGWTA